MFYDSITSGRCTRTELNKAYTDAEGNTYEAGGDVIFTGETTEKDLREAFARNGIYEEPTEEQIENSRTSEMYGTATLCGGGLHVIEQARLVGRRLTVEDGAGATLRLDKGYTDFNEGIAMGAGNAMTMHNSTAAGGAVSFGAGSTLRVTDVNNMGNLKTEDGATLVFDLAGSLVAGKELPLLSISGNWQQTGSLDIQIIPGAPMENRRIVLLSAGKYDKSNWNKEQVHITGCPGDSDESAWVGDTKFHWEGYVLYWGEAPESCYYMGGDHEWNMALENDVWFPDEEYDEDKTVAFHLNAKAVFQRSGNLTVREEINVSDLVLELPTKQDVAGVRLAGAEADLVVNDTLCLKSGTLSIRGGGSTFHLGTVTWEQPQEAVLQIKSDVPGSPLTLDFTRAHFSIPVSACPDGSYCVLDLETANGAGFEFQFNENGITAEHPVISYTYFVMEEQGLAHKPCFGADTQETAPFIYDMDLYIGNHRGFLVTQNDNATWWNPGGAVRNQYDTEKHAASNRQDRIDLLFCAGCTAINIYASWLDKYAPLHTSGQTSPYVSTVMSGAASAGNPRLLNTNKSYDYLLANYTSEEMLSMHVGFYLRDLLCGKEAFGQPFKDWYGADSVHELNPSCGRIDGASFQPGGIYFCNFRNGDFASTRQAATMLSTVVIEGFKASGNAAIGIGVFSPAGSSQPITHVVTCWGYETSYVDVDGDGTQEEIVTRLKVADSDDGTGVGERWYEIVYHDNHAYVVVVDDGKISPQQNFSGYVIRRAFVLTTPSYAEGMLKQYNDPEVPIYWTGVADEWKVDDTCMTYSGNTIVSQKRLAGVEDGWRKLCEAEGHSTWAHSVFTGQENEIRFVDNVAGATLTDARKVVRTAGIDAEGTKAVVTGHGYVFLPAGSGQTVPIRLAGMELRGGTATLAEDILLRAPVTLDSGSRLENYGCISGNVTMCSGSTFLSGCVQSTPEGGLTVIGNGLNGASLVLSGSGKFTVGTTVEVRELGTWDYLKFVAGADIITDAYKNTVNQMFNLSPEEGQTLAYDAIITGATVRDSAAAVAGGAQSFVAGSAFELAGGVDEAITLGSGTVVEDSAAKLVLSSVEGQGSSINAAEADFSTVAGETVSFASDTEVSAKSFTVVAGSRLDNDGRIAVADTLQVAGTLGGDGAFGSTVVKSGGAVQVGSSSFDNLTVESGGALAFTVSGADSALHINEGGALAVEEGAAVSVGFTDSYLDLGNLGVARTLSLVSLDSPADAALAQSLQDSTTFYQVSTDGEATPLDDLHMQVRRFQWAAEDNTLALNVTVGYIHDSELTWGNYERNMTWDTTSANWAGEATADGVFDYGYTCRFTDTGAGRISLVGQLDPDAVVVDSQEDYTFDGDGSLIGEATLTKLGRGALEIGTANTYSGGTVVENGTLRLRNVQAAGTGAIRMRYGELDLNFLAVTNDIMVHEGCVMLQRAGNYAGTLGVSSGIVYLYGNVGGTMEFAGNCILSASDLGLDALTLGTLRFADECDVMLDFGYLRDSVEVGSQYTLFTTSGGETDTSHFSLINSGLREGTYSFHCEDGKVALSIDMTSTVTLRWLGAKGVWSAGGDKEWEFVDGPPTDNRFYHGDAVLFDTAAKVTVSGAVEPETMTVRVMDADTLVLTGKGGIGGFGSVAMEGTGTLKLNATNSYTGGTLITGGTVIATGNDSLGRGAVRLQGGTLNLGGKTVYNGISATGGLLSGAGKYAGALTVEGALELKGTAHAASLTLAGGSISGGTLKDTAVTLGGGAISSAISGKSSVAVTGEATLSGKLSYTGTTTIGEGAILRLEAPATKTGKSALTLAGGTLAADWSLGSKLTLTVGGGVISGDLTLGGGTLVLEDNAALTISGSLAANKSTVLDVSLLKESATITYDTLEGDWAKNLTLSGPQGGRRSYTLDVQEDHLTVTATGENADLTWLGAKGKWEVLGAQEWGGESTDNRFHHGDAVTFSSAAKVTLSGKLAPGGVAVQGDGAVTFSGSGSIAGDAALTMDGSNTLKLNASNAYTGGTLIHSGTVVASGAASFGTGGIELGGGTLDFAGKAVANDVLVSGNASIRNGKAFAGTVTLSAGGTLGLDSGMAGTLVLDGGTLDLSRLSVKSMSKLKFGAVATGAVTTIDVGGFEKLGYGTFKLMTLADTTQLDVLKLRVAGMEDLRGIRPMFHLDGHDLVLTIYAYAEANQFVTDDSPETEEAAEPERTVAAVPVPQHVELPGAGLYTTMMRAQLDGNRAAFDSIRQLMGTGEPSSADGRYRFAAQATSASTDMKDYRRQGFGGLVMVEEVFSDKAVGGLSLNYEHADINPDGAGKYESDDTRVNVHMLVSSKNWQTSSIAGIGIHDYDVNHASATGHSFNLMEEISRTIAVDDRSVVAPFVRVETGYNVIGSINDGVLAIDKQTAWSTDVTLGARYVKNCNFGTVMLEAGVTKAIGDQGGAIGASLVDAPATRAALSPSSRNRWSATLGGSVQVPVGERSAIQAGATLRLHGGTTEVNANVGYSIKF